MIGKSHAVAVCPSCGEDRPNAASALFPRMIQLPRPRTVLLPFCASLSSSQEPAAPLITGLITQRAASKTALRA